MVINNGRGESEIISIPEGPAVVPVVGPPVGRAKAHRDLEDLCVHDVSHHPEETCREQTGDSEETGRNLVDTGGNWRKNGKKLEGKVEAREGKLKGN